MNERTLRYALHVLDSQLHHIENYEKTKNPNAKIQASFYDGAKMMLEILISDVYENNKHINESNGKHSIILLD